MGNFFRTLFFLTVLTMIFMLLGRWAGGSAGMTYAFLFACIMNFGAWWFSDKIVLGMYRAHPVSEFEAPEIYTVVHELTRRAGLPMPRVYVIPSVSPNAFATGRNPRHASIAMTQGIVDLLNREELKGVLAHELAHIKSRDTLIASTAAVFAGAICMLASLFRWGLFFRGGRSPEAREENPLAFLLMVLLAPVAAAIIQLAISRAREYSADLRGAELCGNPLFLASALRQMEAASERFRISQAEPSTAHLFIVNPLRRDVFSRLFSTHPPVHERVARLECLARRRGE